MRAIDADELLTAFPVDDEPTLTKSCVRMTIKNMPTIEPEQRWIPCSERMPEIGKEVLLSEPNTMFIAEYHGSGDPEGLWLVEGYHHYLADVNGCAWMPLPESWKGDKE